MCVSVCVCVCPLPVPGLWSAASNTTLSPSRFDIGRPRSSGSVSPLCAHKHTHTQSTYSIFYNLKETHKTHPSFNTNIHLPHTSTHTHTHTVVRLTMRATRSERCRPYLATTGRRTSVTGLVGLAFRHTERLIGTRSSLVQRRRGESRAGQKEKQERRREEKEGG